MSGSPASSSTDAQQKSFFTDGWRSYVPPVLRSTDGLLRYYVVVLPIVMPAAVLLMIGGKYAVYGAYVTVGLFVLISSAYTVWLIRKLKTDDRDTGARESAHGQRSDRPGQPSSRESGGESRVRR
ncbi:hypothetical protein CRI94_17045 [Longibacter salinarum]|uniref:Uncharacterized protein n=1 Tax=Longibacter salinarum TaxID=1850348 RepID=A0A2A8CU62_9BACT|nr:hypothetical protein [Longibacter salinarum]PEN10939.1 hypothetical protein CRI94_17045 [Longibacter salinarum]